MGSFRYPLGAQKDPFGPKGLMSVLGVPEGPRGPALVQTAANCSDWVGIMVTTHIGLVLGLFWAPRYPERAYFGLKDH